MKKHFSLKNLFKSMRSRIFVFGLLIGIIPCILFSLGFSFVYESEAEKAEVLSVTGESQILGNDILTSGYLKSPTDEAVNITLDSVCLIPGTPRSIHSLQPWVIFTQGVLWL